MDTYRQHGRKLEGRGKKRLHAALFKKLCKTRSRIFVCNIFRLRGEKKNFPDQFWGLRRSPAVPGALGLKGEIAYKIRLRHTAAFGRG